MSTGRSPAISDRSATRADLLDDRTAENMAAGQHERPAGGRQRQRWSPNPPRARVYPSLEDEYPLCCIQQYQGWAISGSMSAPSKSAIAVVRAWPRRASPTRDADGNLGFALRLLVGFIATLAVVELVGFVIIDRNARSSQIAQYCGDAAERRQDLRDDRPSQPDDGLGADQDRRRPRRPGEASRHPRGEGVRRARRDPRLRRSRASSGRSTPIRGSQT